MIGAKSSICSCQPSSMTSATVAATRLKVVSTVGPCGCPAQKRRRQIDATTTPATKHSISTAAVTDSFTSWRTYPNTARWALPVMNVTKYPAEWVNAVAPSTPASPASTHDSRASLSKISLATRTCFQTASVHAAGKRLDGRQPGDGPQRDRQPPGPVPRLVDGLVEFIGGQQLRRIPWVDPGRGRVAVAERGAIALDPFAGAGGQLLVGGLVHQRPVGGVLEGTQDTGHVAQR